MNSVHLGAQAEQMNGNYRADFLSPLSLQSAIRICLTIFCDVALNRCRRDVAGRGVDINEDWLGSDARNAPGGGKERVRTRNDGGAAAEFDRHQHLSERRP